MGDKNPNKPKKKKKEDNKSCAAAPSVKDIAPAASSPSKKKPKA